MIYVCIPAHNEAATLGVVLWKTRRVLAEAGRDFRVAVYDDASSDGTKEVLERYNRFVPLVVLRSPKRIGYARATARLLGWAAERSSYPKRDFAVLMQADLTEDPADLLPMVKTLEGGVDLVASRPQVRGHEGTGHEGTPRHERRPATLFRRLAGRVFERHLPQGLPGDPFSGMRACRIKVLRDAFEESAKETRTVSSTRRKAERKGARAPAAGSHASEPSNLGRDVFRSDGWGANAEALALFARHARRSAEVEISVRPHLRVRRSRLNPVRELVRLVRGVRAVKASSAHSRPAASAALLLASVIALPWTAHAQESGMATDAALLDSLAAHYPADAEAAPVAFGPGEILSYRVELGWFDVGVGHLSIDGIDEVRGNPSYRASLNIDGGKLGFRYKQEHTTFIDTGTLQSHRYLRITDQTGYQGRRHYEMYPEEGEWRREDIEDSGPLGSSLPLDDISFIYYLRQMELEVGKTYTVPRYFKEDGNPVVIRVLRRETREVDAGVFDCLVVEPVVQVEGMFAEGMEAELYLTDDDRRLLVYMRTDVPRLPGALELYLTGHRAGLPLNPDPRARVVERARLAQQAPHASGTSGN